MIKFQELLRQKRMLDGITPRYIHEFVRLKDLREYILDCTTECLPISPEVIKEYSELVCKLRLEGRI